MNVGESVELETPLISLESDKAVMDVPSPVVGTIREMKISEGDKVNAGDLIALAEVNGTQTAEEAKKEPAIPKEKKEETFIPEKPSEESASEPPASAAAPSPPASPPVNAQAPGSKYHATPSVRGLARELGVSLSLVSGTGPKGRITRDDVTALVKSAMSGGGPGLPPIPKGTMGPSERLNMFP